MSQKGFSLVIIVAAFLGGSYLAVLDPVNVQWAWFLPVLGAGAAGLWGFRRAMHVEASAGHRLEGDMQTLAGSLRNIVRNLEALEDGKRDLPVYDARFEIDRLLRRDLDEFARARETMVHVFGMKDYADVMSAFAAGERYINRVWSASTDGYEQEVHRYLERARDQFIEAENLFDTLQDRHRAQPGGTGTRQPGDHRRQARTET